MKSKKKLILGHLTIAYGICVLLLFFASVFLFAGCTIHFKAEKMELETKPPEAKIGNTTETNASYKLAAIDILR